MSDEDPAWARAFGRLEELQRAATTTALLRGAHRTGLLQALAEPMDPESLATALGLPASRVRAALEVLGAHEIATSDDGRWRLADGWAELVAGATPVGLAGTLGLGRVWAEQFDAALERGLDYWELDAADRLEVATGISPDPASPATIAMARGLVESLPGVADALAGGGRALELGCGLASRLCALLRAYPAAGAVGVELDGELVAAARARAEALGVADRLELMVGDATAYDGEGSFVVASWSQFFFPEPSRAGALAAAFRSLGPGGWLSMPVIWEGEVPPPGTSAAQELAEMRLVLDLWGVPARTVAEIIAEVERAGFVEVHSRPAPGFHVVRARRP